MNEIYIKQERHTWIRSVPSAVADGCMRSNLNRARLLRTHPLPRMVLTVSKFGLRLDVGRDAWIQSALPSRVRILLG